MDELQKTDALNGRLQRAADTVGNLLVDGFRCLALFASGATVV